MKVLRINTIMRLFFSLIYETMSVIYIVRLFLDEPTGDWVLLLEWAPLFKYVFPSILMFSVAIYSLISIVDSLCLLLNSNRLKNRYIRLSDERLVLIREKSGTKFFIVILYIEILITVIFGEDNPVLFAGLLLNLVLIALVYVGFRVFNTWKFK